MQFQEFASRAEASQAAAAALATTLREQLARNSQITLVVSGGSTPQACFRQLSKTPLNWDRVIVTLTDERCVPSNHADSNEAMVRANLMQGAASNAVFQAPDQAVPEPFAAVLLGMGADGHFASLFADANNLDEGLAMEQSARVLPISTAASPHPRISMPLARLLRTDCLLLLVFGDDKRTVLETPRSAGNISLPIHALLERNPPALSIYWAK